MTVRLYKNARAIVGDRVKDVCVLTENGRIVRIAQRIDAPEAEVFDCGGNYLSPGFADIHVHGGGGFSAMSDNPDDIVNMCTAHAKHGVTAIVPTTLAAPVPRLQRAIETIGRAMEVPRR